MLRDSYYFLVVALFLVYTVAHLTSRLWATLSPLRVKRFTETTPKAWSFLDADHGATDTLKLFLSILQRAAIVPAFAFLAFALEGSGMPYPWVVAFVLLMALLLVLEAAIFAIPDAWRERLLRLVFPGIALLYYVPFYPIVLLFIRPLSRGIAVSRRRDEAQDPNENASDEEVQAFIDAGQEEGILDDEESKMVSSIVDFGDTLVKEVMTPRIDMVCAPAGIGVEELARLFVESKYSRIPLYRGTIDTIEGFIHVKDIFDVVSGNARRSTAELVRRVVMVPENKKVTDLLREFQRSHLQMSIVADEYGGTAGLVTLEDLLEEIVGEIGDEHEDEGPEVTALDDGSYVFTGKAHISHLETIFELDLEEQGYDTIGGMVVAALGYVPKPGERIEREGVIFLVERADKRRILQVRVSRDALDREGREGREGT